MLNKLCQARLSTTQTFSDDYALNNYDIPNDINVRTGVVNPLVNNSVFSQENYYTKNTLPSVSYTFNPVMKDPYIVIQSNITNPSILLKSEEDISGKAIKDLITGVDFVPKMNSLMPVVALKKPSEELGLDIVTPESFSWSSRDDVQKNRFFSSIPPTFVPNLLPPIDQKNCGACYAIASATHFVDRYNIWTLNEEHINVSFQEIVNCTIGGCDGGFPYEACLYLENNGLPQGSYDDYTATKKDCEAKYAKRYMALSGSSYSVGDTNVEKSQKEIKREIYENGPVIGCLAVFDELRKYKEGIYKLSENPGVLLGMHAVVIVGWEKKCWIVRNSWGDSWGDNGYFRIGFGECGIDSFNLIKYMEMMRANTDTKQTYRETKYGGIVATFPDVGKKIPRHMLTLLAKYRDPRSFRVNSNCYEGILTKLCEYDYQKIETIILLLLIIISLNIVRLLLQK